MWVNAGLLLLLTSTACSKCFEPNPSFPVPEWTTLGSALKPTFEKIGSTLKDIVSHGKYDTSSYSVEVTSSSETLWGDYHTARRRNDTRPGVKHVDSSSQYRIASITKAFTTLAILYQHNANNLSLDDPVSNYIVNLNSDEYELPWKDITLRNLASQLSGIPREFAQSDLINYPLDPSYYGLPPASKDGLPECDEYNGYERPCDATDLLEQLKGQKPLFAPNQKSTYSNLNFELLGLVIENVTGVSYEEYITQAIFEPLNMTFSTLERPESDERAVLPILSEDTFYTTDGKNYWDVDEGVQNPTGGIYSSSGDLSKFLRYILTHYNTIATGVNWLLPGSWGTGMNTFYGMPFEIFRTDRILEESTRPITFVTKSGGLPGYYSRISILEEYGLGITVLVGGAAGLVGDILEAVSVEVVRAAEKILWAAIDQTHAGNYASTTASLNSSLILKVSPSKGLYIGTFISNGTDVLQALFQKIVDTKQPWHLQLVPTLLFEDEKKQRGEIWRAIAVSERAERAEGEGRIWDDDCVTDVDQLSYAGKPVNKVVFWHEEGVVELTAWNVTLKRDVKDAGGLVIQG